MTWWCAFSNFMARVPALIRMLRVKPLNRRLRAILGGWMGHRYHRVHYPKEYFVNSAPALNESLPLGIWKIAAVIVTLAAVSFICVAPQIANDFWLQAKVGELIASNFEIPKTLLFPFTDIQSAQFNAHEWLSALSESSQACCTGVFF